DISLDAVIVSDHVEIGILRAGIALPQNPFTTTAKSIGLVGTDDFDQIHTGQSGKSAGQLKCPGLIDLARHDATGLRTLFTQDAGQFSCINVGDTDNIVGNQVLGKTLFST